MIILYPRLKEFRESLGLTQTEFGKSIGIAKSTYSNYETGLRDPKSDFWIAIAQTYGVTIDYLMGYSDNRYQTEGNIQKAPSYSDEAMKLAYDFDNRVDDWGRRHLRDTADFEIERYETELKHTKEKKAVYKSTDTIISLPEQRVIYLPEPIQSASAGTGQIADDDTAEQVAVYYNEITSKADFIMRVSGDSMEPDIMDGDRVLVRRQPAVEIGETGIFIREGERYIKIYRGSYLESINPEYGDVSLEEYSRCLGKVIGVLEPEWIAE